jgi:LPS sulfotransferase NodH
MPSFAILCVGRVGSEHLVSLLDSHPDITCFSELFAPPWAVEYQRDTLSVPHFAETPHERPLSYWQELTKGLDTPVNGLKLPGSSIDAHPDAAELIADPEVRIIRLTRRDRLAQYVSLYLALASDAWHSTQGGYRKDKIRVNVRDCLAGLDQIAQLEARLDELAHGQSVFELPYEELVEGQRIDELQAFLGVRPRKLGSRYDRLRARPLSEVVENFDELTAALTGTPYAADLGATVP